MDREAWDHHTDVLIVGSGAAAMVAALVAHDGGARTLLVERSDRYGGTSAMSGARIERAGRSLRVRAQRGVLLGAGGFEANQALREKYLPLSSRAEWTCASPHSQGDALELGRSVVYAFGNCSASVMGRTYPGPGCTLGAATAFGYVAARHALDAGAARERGCA